MELGVAAAVAVLAAASLEAPAVMRTWLNTTLEPVNVASMVVLAAKPASDPTMVAVHTASVVFVKMHFSITARNVQLDGDAEEVVLERRELPCASMPETRLAADRRNVEPCSVTVC